MGGKSLRCRFPERNDRSCLLRQSGISKYRQNDIRGKSRLRHRYYLPNPKGEELKTRPVENMALHIREILAKDYSLGGWALNSSVDRIIFGTPAGMNTVGRALILYTVELKRRKYNGTCDKTARYGSGTW